MRTAKIERNTAETKIKLELNLDGTGQSHINTGLGFLDHMMTLFAAHGRFDLNLECAGDLEVDAHHTTEDIGIALGEAFADALGEKRGIVRYGFFILPMDEALVRTALDFSGRPYLDYDVKVPLKKLGVYDTELTEEFWLGFVRNAGCTLHIKKISGKNSHHILEAVFKCAARAIRAAVKIDPELSGKIPSTKGVL